MYRRRTMLDWLRRLFRKSNPMSVTPDEAVVKAYVEAGTYFGDSVSYLYLGECIGFEDQLAAWERAEGAYAALGYRTLSLDAFIEAGGYGKRLMDLRVPRDVGETPVLHAAYYREHFLGRAGRHPAVEIAFKGEVATGTYTLPSTKHLSKR